MSWISFASLLYVMTKSNHPSSIFLTTYKLNFKVRTTQRCLIEIFHIFQQSVYKLLKASPILWESLYLIHAAVSWRYWRKTNSYTAPTLTRKRWVRACLDTISSISPGIRLLRLHIPAVVTRCAPGGRVLTPWEGNNRNSALLKPLNAAMAAGVDYCVLVTSFISTSKWQLSISACAKQNRLIPWHTQVTV